MKQPSPQAGFSLVEVVLAVGVAAFVLVSITGLLSVSLKSARESTTDTLLVTMSSRVLSGLRAQAFTNISPSPFNPSLQPVTNRVYFDDLGMPANSPAPGGYSCDVVLQGDTNFYNPDPAITNVAERFGMLRVKLIFTSTNQPGTSRVIQSTLAQY